ncbi:MAG: electron transfer flavoprotein subunit beta/FixA family protein [Gammaproteobacteria bacterium]|nr:electron transfer flavoprotein subunit beta/FixA family protein [Gammaproteobacteria bacterium]
MKILVPCKRVPDPDQKPRLNADGSNIDDVAVSFILNPFDAIAVEEALRIREVAHPDAEIVAVGICPVDGEAELRTALAMGADRALLVEHAGMSDPWNIARLLAAVIEREQPGLVLMGKQAVDDDSNQTSQFLAALLNWPQATFASQLEFFDGGLRVHRETDLGIEIIRVTLPAVVTADLRLNEPRYASLPSILKAKKKSIEHTTPAELGVALEPRVQLLSMEVVNSQRQCEQVSNAADLLARLREAEVIE